MKIIFGIDQAKLEVDAAEQLKNQKRVQLKHGVVVPIGIPLHAARIPHICDDCGETYWGRESDSWTPHLSCMRKTKVGF